MAGPFDDLIPGVWNLRRVTAAVSYPVRRVKQILSRRKRADATVPDELPSNAIEVTGVTERLRQNLLLACVEETFLTFLLHALLENHSLADRLLADWHAKFIEF